MAAAPRRRPRKRADRPGNHEDNLVMERKDAATNRRLILSAIGTVERKSDEIAAMVGIAGQTVRRHLRIMHKLGMVHIKRRFRHHIKWDALWLAGPGEDAPIPPPIDNAERVRRARIKRELDGEAFVRRKNQLTKYGLLARAPRSDPAAAWINSPGGNNV